MIKLSVPKFRKTRKYFKKLDRIDVRPLLERMGQEGIVALANSTPVDSGETSSMWEYKIESKNGGREYKLSWTNSAMGGRTPIVILLQYGHATKSGYFLSGRDFINPALRPVYQNFMKSLGQEVAS
jgi:hypothetical protein